MTDMSEHKKSTLCLSKEQIQNIFANPQEMINRFQENKQNSTIFSVDKRAVFKKSSMFIWKNVNLYQPYMNPFSCQKYDNSSLTSSKSFQLYRHLKLVGAVSTNDTEKLLRVLSTSIPTNINKPDKNRRTLLHMASCRGYKDVVEILLTYGADPNVQDVLGNTPLHIAVISTSTKTYVDCIQLLIKHGAKIMLDYNGKTPLQLVLSKINLIETVYKNTTTDKSEILKNLLFAQNLLEQLVQKEVDFKNDYVKLGDYFQNLSANDSSQDEQQQKQSSSAIPHVDSSNDDNTLEGMMTDN